MGIDFIGIGVQKGGTTWLYERLSSHPHVRFPAGKEVHFWDSKAARQPRDYLELFPDVAPPVKSGEITPAYSSMDEWRIEAMSSTVPHVKLFLSIRNPLSRAWSAARMWLDRTMMKTHEASDRWFLELFRSEANYRRGLYTETIATWKRYFPLDQLHLIIFDDLVERPKAVLVDLARHIGVDPAYFETMDEQVVSEKVHSSRDRPIRPSLVGPLREMYEQEIADLSLLLERNLHKWVEWDGTMEGEPPRRSFAPAQLPAKARRPIRPRPGGGPLPPVQA